MVREAEWRCERCRRRGNLELHHIVPLADGGSLIDRNNVEVLCRSCHLAEHHPHDPARAEWYRELGIVRRR